METCHRLFGSVQYLTAKKERGERNGQQVIDLRSDYHLTPMPWEML